MGDEKGGAVRGGLSYLLEVEGAGVYVGEGRVGVGAGAKIGFARGTDLTVIFFGWLHCRHRKERGNVSIWDRNPKNFHQIDPPQHDKGPALPSQKQPSHSHPP
jgi:hypothetical protein